MKKIAYAEALVRQQQPQSKNKRTFLVKNIEFIRLRSDCVVNVLSGVVPTDKAELQQFESQLRHISGKHFSVLQRSELFQKTKGHSLIRLIVRPCLQSYRKKPTEEFVLVPRNMFKTDQPQVLQIINNPFKNKQVKTTIAFTENVETRATTSSHTAEHGAIDQ